MIKLEYLALRWLRFEKRCPLIFMERGLRTPYGARPDVCGVCERRYVTEVEVKRSYSDFRANFAKRHVVMRDACIENWPRYFYFAVPESLVSRVLPELPDYAGLLSMTHIAKAVKPAPRNEASRRISVKELCKLVRVLGNQILSTEEKLANRIELLTHTYEPCEY